jgi:hypothetical protein
MLKANNQPFSFHLAGTLKEKIPFLSIPIDDTKNSHGNWYIPAPKLRYAPGQPPRPSIPQIPPL